MIQKNLYFHYCAIIILLILIMTTIMRRMVKGKTNRCFLLVLGITCLSVVFDIWAVRLDNMHGLYVVQKQVAHICYLTAHTLTMPACIIYIISLTDTWHLVLKRKLLAILFSLPALISVIMIVTNPLTNLMFYFNEIGDYTRGKAFYILYAGALVYLNLGIVLVIMFRNRLRRRHLVSLGAVYVCEIFAVVIQLLHPEFLVEMFGMAAGLLFVSLMIQRPEENIDVVTRLGKLTAYTEAMNRSFLNQKPTRIIMLNITNHDTVRELIGYSKHMQAMKRIAKYLEDLNREYKLYADAYYLERGKFRLVVEERNFDKVREIAETINEHMKKNVVINQMAVNLVANTCIVDCPDDISDVETLMAFGDMLDTVSVTGEILWASELLKQTHFDMMRDMDAIIENALANNRFSVYYQPIYSVNEKRFHSAEALLRLKDEKYGFVSPDLFIPAAEKSGAIHKIGDFVLDEVCKFIASDSYQALGLDYIEVNLSVAQCMQPSLVKQVLNTLEKHQVRPEQINLEITETAASISQQALVNNIEELTSAGVRFSLDDFGTGYSNMQRVVSLSFDIIKLDKSFTDIYHNPKLAIMVKNTIHMIKAMQMKIVVEGVETEDMVQLFSKLECEYIQGYYFSKPMPRDDFTKFIQASM